MKGKGGVQKRRGGAEEEGAGRGREGLGSCLLILNSLLEQKLSL